MLTSNSIITLMATSNKWGLSKVLSIKTFQVTLVPSKNWSKSDLEAKFQLLYLGIVMEFILLKWSTDFYDNDVDDHYFLIFLFLSLSISSLYLRISSSNDCADAKIIFNRQEFNTFKWSHKIELPWLPISRPSPPVWNVQKIPFKCETDRPTSQ